jgi:tryptophanyl-tRNA synthetase
MFKSAINPNSRILLTDAYETIAKRIRGAVMDSIPSIMFDRVERPGASNLLVILSACMGEGLAVLSQRYATRNPSAQEKDVVEAVEEVLRKPHAKFGHLRKEKMFLAQAPRDGAERARGHSDCTLEVRKRVQLQLRVACITQ